MFVLPGGAAGPWIPWPRTTASRALLRHAIPLANSWLHCVGDLSTALLCPWELLSSVHYSKLCAAISDMAAN
eukprot:7246058-Pyramimonas_sp.AAC.1